MPIDWSDKSSVIEQSPVLHQVILSYLLTEVLLVEMIHQTHHHHHQVSMISKW